MTLPKGESEEEPLYPHSEDDIAPRFSEESQFRHHRLLWAMSIGTNITLLILCVVLFHQAQKLNKRIHNIEPDLFPSLARSSAVARQYRVFPLTVAGTPFAGDPSEDLDQAWHELLEGTTIRVQREDLENYNITSLPLADGSGFASELFFTHELHCLKKVRQWVYKETYFTHVQGLARNELKRHIDHCIETLRQGIMCRGDVSLGTYTYIRGTGNVTARSWASHQCVDFGTLMAWNRKRSVNIFEEGVLVKPEDVGDEHMTEKRPPH